MSVNQHGRVVGGGMPVGKAGASRNEVGEVRTRKATPEELAGLDEAIRRKYGEKELERDKKKARAAMVVKDMMKRSRRRKPDMGSREPDAEYIQRMQKAVKGVSRERWEVLRAFVMVAGAVHGWNGELDDAETKD